MGKAEIDRTDKQYDLLFLFFIPSVSCIQLTFHDINCGLIITLYTLAACILSSNVQWCVLCFLGMRVTPYKPAVRTLPKPRVTWLFLLLATVYCV